MTREIGNNLQVKDRAGIQTSRRLKHSSSLSEVIVLQVRFPPSAPEPCSFQSIAVFSTAECYGCDFSPPRCRLASAISWRMFSSPCPGGCFACFRQLEKWKWFEPQNLWNKSTTSSRDDFSSGYRGLRYKGWSWTAPRTQAAVTRILVHVWTHRGWFRSWKSPH